MKRKIIAGFMATIFLTTVFAAFPVQVSAYTGAPIYVGIIGPKGLIQWDGIWEGAQLARDLINDAGGLVDSDGKTHELRLVDIDESPPWVPRPSWDGVTELLAALDTYPTMQFLIGGFYGESCFPMREAAMDYAAVHGRPIWIICGASSDELIDDGPDSDNPYDDVREDYERYKYMFRASPFNTTTYLNTLAAFLRDHVLPQKLVPLYGSPVKTYIIADDLLWCDGIVDSLQGGALGTQAEIVGVGRPSPIETDFTPFLDQIEDSGAKLAIHLLAAASGANFIWQWRQRKVSAVPVGINVVSGLSLVYCEISGAYDYETILGQGSRTNINPDAKPLSTVEFWDEYKARYGHAPLPTAWGVYIELMHLNKTTADWIGKTCDEIVPILEETEFDTLLGHFKYTDYHDVYCDKFSLTPIWPPAGWPGTLKASIGTVRPLFFQWQADRREVMWPRGYAPAPGSESEPALQDPTPLPWARKWKIPPWMYSLGETDFAGGDIIPSPLMAVGDTPAGWFGYFTAPDGSVGGADMTVVTGLWQQPCPWNVLEADMDGNQFIDIEDVARVAWDWGKTATPQD